MTHSAPQLVLTLADAGSDVDSPQIGAKAQSLVSIQRLGLPTPPAFVITREAFRLWESGRVPDAFWAHVRDMWHALTSEYQSIFPGRPLVASVRSSGPKSMPGIMDTSLYVGLTSDAAAQFRAASEDSALGAFFEDLLTVRSELLKDSPELDAAGQVRRAVEACWSSANAALASLYRDRYSLDRTENWTGVVIQGMVFGALGADSGTGVIFSRNPISGASPEGMFGEWIPSQAGTSLVGGTSTPLSLADFDLRFPSHSSQLRAGVSALERLRGDAQEVEFTVERGQLWFLQTKDAKRTPEASRVIASHLFNEGIIPEAERNRRLAAAKRDESPVFSEARRARSRGKLLVQGFAAAPGTGIGIGVRDVEAAVRLHTSGSQVVLVRETTSPSDLAGMLVADAIVTARGGATSHAAVLARELGKPCVVGCGEDTVALLEGRQLHVDGTLGQVHAIDGSLN